MLGYLKTTFVCLQLFVVGTVSDAVKKTIVYTPLAPTPFSQYSQAVIVGDTIYLAGQIGVTVDRVLVDGITNQTRQILRNIGFVLEAANSSFDNVVKTTVMLANIWDAQAMGAVYREFFPQDFQARSTFQVAALHGVCIPNFSGDLCFWANAMLGALIEVEAVAVSGSGYVLSTFWITILIIYNLLSVNNERRFI